jgi:hypothetical protein
LIRAALRLIEILSIAVEVAVAPITSAPVTTTRAAIRNTEHTLDAADRATDASTNRTSDHATNRTCSTITLARALIATALHPSNNALCLRQMGNG